MQKVDWVNFIPHWSWIVPLMSWVFVLIWLVAPDFGLLPILLAVGLLASVMSAVHHAEVISARVGEPFGTLILALSVTLIEVALIVSMMLSAGDGAMTLPRDTLFASIMIIMNGIIGLSLLMGGRKNSEQQFNLEGTTETLGTISLIVVLTLILPNYTSGLEGVLSPVQLGFLAVATFVVYISFIRFQTLLHRDYFIEVSSVAGGAEVAETPSTSTAVICLGLLAASLAAVVMSAQGISPALKAIIETSGAPSAMLGVIIAAIVLLPEFTASVRAARQDRLQTSLNLALGSAMASIGLTVPVVSLLALWMQWPLQWGLDSIAMILLVLTLFLVAQSLRTGNTTRQPGILHLSLFVTFLFFSLFP